MIKLEVEKHYFHCGEALVDIQFAIQIKFEDEDGSIKYAYKINNPEWNEYGISLNSVFNPMEETNEAQLEFDKGISELYSTIKECKKSKYYSLFKDLDFVCKKYSEEIYEAIDDTKYTGPRCGAMYDSEGLTYYIESCSHISATDTYYYIQVKYNNGKYHYSVTDRSIYLRLQMKEFYNSYYKDSKVNYYIDSDNINDLEKIEYMKEDALKDIEILDEFMSKLNSN